MEGTSEPGTEGFGQDIQGLAEYFNADDGLLAPTRETRIQWTFDVMMELFDRVGLCNNVGKTVIMECQKFYDIGGHSMEAYGIRMMGGGLAYRERLRQRVRCPSPMRTWQQDPRRPIGRSSTGWYRNN